MSTETIVGNIISGIVGGLAVALAQHFLTKDREKNRDRQAAERAASEAKEKRRLEFLGFLKKWRTEIFSPSDEKIGGWRDLSFASVSAFQNKLSSFNSESVLVQNDFPDRQRFDSLTERIAGLKSEDWNKKQPREVICEAIDALIKFCS